MKKHLFLILAFLIPFVSCAYINDITQIQNFKDGIQIDGSATISEINTTGISTGTGVDSELLTGSAIEASISNITSELITDSAYSSEWNGDTTSGRSANAIYDKIDLIDTAEALNTAHRTSDGSDHSFINQDVTIGSSPVLDSTNITGITSTSVEMLEIGTATLNNVQDWSNSIQSAGIISGGDITTGGSGTVDVSASTGILKSSTDNNGTNYFFNMTELTAQALTDDSINYIAIDYNSGTPQYVISTSNVANGNTIINLGKVYREGNTVDIINGGLRIYNAQKEQQIHHIYETGMQHFVTGGVVGEIGILNLTVTDGIFYAGMNPETTRAIDTSLSYDITGVGTGGTVSANNTIIIDSGEGDVSGCCYYGSHIILENSSNGNDGLYHVQSSSFDGTNTTVIIQETTLITGADTGNLRPDSFEYYYYNGTTWIETDDTDIDNLQYNDTAAGLATLASQNYGIHWIYKGTNGFTYILYGQGSYTLIQAEAAQPPASLPVHVSEMGMLRAKIIVKKSDVVFTEIQNVATTEFTGSAAAVHNELSGLNDDDYKHLTAVEYTKATTVSTTSAIGLAPILSGNSLQFLNGNGTFSVPAGGGDVLGPAANTDSYIPQWDGTDSKTLKNGVELSTDGTLAGDSDTAVPTEKATKLYVDTEIEDISYATTIAISDETTDLTTGLKRTIRAPEAMTLTGVRASVTTAPTGSALTFDIKEAGTTILSTKITIDATELTSTTAATPPVVSDSAIADDASLTFHIDTIGSTTAGAGAKITLIWTK